MAVNNNSAAFARHHKIGPLHELDGFLLCIIRLIPNGGKLPELLVACCAGYLISIITDFRFPVAIVDYAWSGKVHDEI